MDAYQILYEFFGKRIAEGGQFGLVEYLVYGSIMLGLCFLLIYPALNRKGIRFDSRFMLALLPYVLLGSLIHVIEDMELIASSHSPLELGYWAVTPGIYIAIAAATLFFLAVSWAASRKSVLPFHLFFGLFGAAMALPTMVFVMLGFREWQGFFAVIALTAVLTALTAFAFNKILKSGLMRNRLNVMAVASQLLDGTATFVAVQFFGYGEQHPASGFFLQMFPFSFVIVKLLLVLAVLYYIDKHAGDKNLAGFVKVMVAVLGFATGLRDIFRLGALA